MRKISSTDFKNFLLLGGGSLVFLAATKLLIPSNEENIHRSIEITFLLANIINHPHFAASYFIFYQDFYKKIKGNNLTLNIKYLLAGIAYPILFATTCIYFISNENVSAVGLIANFMFFIVGWHYAKQGYGMLMLECFRKKIFFNNEQKKIFLLNAYSAWTFSWILINYSNKNTSPSYWGIPYSFIEIPDNVFYTSLLVFILSALTLINTLFKIRKINKKLPYNGLLFFSVSAYAWLIIRDPIAILWIPLFHSLQYLTVVFTYQKNKFDLNPKKNIGTPTRIIIFFFSCILSGYAFFYLIPQFIDQQNIYNHEIWGANLFMFIFWIFINTHHYLLDTVTWRKENKEIKDYLYKN